MAPKRRGGIEVRTVQRGTGAETERASGSSTSSGRGHSAQRRGRGRSRPSARYREKALGAARPGESFFRDAELASHFEKRVLEIYAPTPSVEESVRELPLRLQAQRDGRSFCLPGLADMCVAVAADHFASRVLPLLLREEEDTIPPSQKRRRMNTLDAATGQADGGDNEELLERTHTRNAHLITLLPPKISTALQMRLERLAPHLLSYHVLASYFLTPSKVTAASSCRVLGVEGGTGARGLAILLRRLCMSPARAMSVPSPAATLRRLHLQAHTRLSTLQLMPLFKEAASLEELCLRGCISVTSEAIEQLVRSAGKTLRVVNLNWTGVGVEGVEAVIGGCPQLEVLKVAHVRNLTNTTVPAMMERISRATTGRSGIPLARLTTLKLRGTQVGNLAVGSFLKHCGCKLATLDIADTHFGGLGSIEILLLMLGFTVPGPVGRGRNTSLRKLNLSGLSLPPSEISLLLDHIALCESLQVLNFCQVHSHPQGGGYSELGIGVPGESLGRLLGIVCASGPVEERNESSTGMRHCPVGHRDGVASPFPYAYERLAISNKVLGGIELDGLWRSCECMRQDFGWYGVRNMDLSGLDLGSFVESGEAGYSDWLGCQNLNLSGCNLPEEPDWGNIGAAGSLRSVDLGGTRVTERAVDRLLAENPFVSRINLMGCRGIPVTRRRNYFRDWQGV